MRIGKIENVLLTFFYLFWNSDTVRDSIEQLKQDIRNIDKRKEIEDADEPKSKKKAKGMSMLEMEREKYLLGGKVFVGGKRGKKKGDDAEV